MSLMKNMLRSLTVAAALVATSFAAHAAGDQLRLDKANVQFDNASLQNGAKLFVNYCLNCHSASSFRYNRLMQAGLSEQQIKDNLLFTADKVGEQMKTAMRREDGAQWFGAAPPDLSVIARARSSEFGTGADWLYTYLRQFYRDDSRPTGWNNVVFPNVGMPHALWELQGEQVARFVEEDDGHGNKVTHVQRLEIVTPGKLSKDEFDEEVRDLVSFLAWVGEPVQESRPVIGWIVLAVLSVLALLTYLLKRSYWRDVH